MDAKVVGGPLVLLALCVKAHSLHPSPHYHSISHQSHAIAIPAALSMVLVDVFRS